MLTFDAHLDLSLNGVEYGRDLRLSIEEIRSNESGMTDLGGRQRSTVCFPEMRKAGVGLCVATQLAGCMKPASPVGSHDTPEQAWQATQRQLGWYRQMEQLGELVQLTTWEQVQTQIQCWKKTPENSPIGYILSLEGTDSLRTLDDLHSAYEYGLRAVGPAHYGMGRYAPGHDKDSKFPQRGKELLKAMDQLGMILDVTHLCEKAFWEAIDIYEGPIWASHSNSRAIVDDPRQLNDEQIKALAKRGAVIGMAFDVWMVVPGWQRGITTHLNKLDATLENATAHIDHVSQILGTTKHTGIGTDLDGGFGYEQTPFGLSSIANLNEFKLALKNRGYCDESLEGIFSQNYLRFLRNCWA